MDLHVFKKEMMAGAQQEERELLAEIDPELLALVGGGADSQPKARAWFANASFSKRF
ncbi:hypothetical protein [Trinickia violacea]|uniref:hypothetical protein n=1 Tax=Trinickia violacea TaxID=2571746 RepID=UPI001585D32C|nr:hypothetical protein [Trinickia violacea]